MNGSPPTLADVFAFVNSFHEDCRNLVRDTARLLRDREQLFLTRHERWDYAIKPNDRFLDQKFSMVQRCWTVYLPPGPGRGAVFCLEFFNLRRRTQPALIYGALDPGEAACDAADRWAAYHTIVDAENGATTVTTERAGPVAVVRGQMPARFEVATVVKVPLTQIADQASLIRCVVTPLAQLLRGDAAAAGRSLIDVDTEEWPATADEAELDGTAAGEADEAERP